MPFSGESYDPETLVLLTRVFDEAWGELQTLLVVKPVDTVAIRTMLAVRIMTAARDGERDPGKLKLIALRAIDA